jgi:hypothetical protein
LFPIFCLFVATGLQIYSVFVKSFKVYYFLSLKFLTLQTRSAHVSCSLMKRKFYVETESNLQVILEALEQHKLLCCRYINVIINLALVTKTNEMNNMNVQCLTIAYNLFYTFQNWDKPVSGHNPTYIVGITNLPWDFDPAFQRRFNHKVLIENPNDKDRTLLWRALVGMHAITDHQFSDLTDQSTGKKGRFF